MIGEPALARVLRRRDLVAFAVNGVVGAGIFGIPAVLAARAGAFSWLAMLLAGVIVTLITLCFAEVGSAFAETGGPYLYARDVFGPAIGFEVGWLLWIARLSGFGAVLNLFISYAAFFVPSAAHGVTRVAIVCTVVLVLTAINYVGIRRAATVSNAITLAKLAPLLAFVFAGLFFVHWSRMVPSGSVSVEQLFGAVMLAIYAFSGFELLAIPAGEIRDPAHAIPFSLLAGLAIVAFVYLGVQIVCVGVLPSLAASERPLADAARTALGSVASSVMVVGALLSTLGVAHTIVLAAARLPFGMAEQGQLPRRLAAVHPTYRTPYVSLLLSAACVLVVTLLTSFVSAVTLTVGLRVLVYLSTCAALPVLRRRGATRPAFRVPGGDAIAVLSVLICVLLVSIRPWRETQQLLEAVALGLVLYVVCRPAARARIGVS